MPHSHPASWRLYAARGQRKYLSADERSRFLAAADATPPQLRALCYLLAWSGCRLSEALDLAAPDLDRLAGSVAIRSLKKRDRPSVREVPIPDDLVDQLGRLSVAGRFCPWARTTAWRHVKEVMAAAGIAGLHASPKGLRHGFGVHAVRSGVPLNLVQRWLGHADIATTAIYADAMGVEERQIAARMW